MQNYLAVQDGSPYANNILSNTNNPEVWAIESKLDWSIKTSPLMYRTEDSFDSEIHSDLKKLVLFRSDNNKNLGVVSDRYKVVQPQTVLNFYKKLSDKLSVNLEAAGQVKGGKVIWGLADLGNTFRVKGQDEIRSRLMFSTSYDGTRATTIHFISQRIVCNNMLNFAFNQASNSPFYVRIPHMVEANDEMFDDVVNAIVSGNTKYWKDFEEKSNYMSDIKLSQKEVIEYLTDVFSVKERNGDVTVPAQNLNHIQKVMDVYVNGVGQNTRSAKGSLWGALNAVTRYIDHEKKYRTNENNIFNTQFGVGKDIKNKAFKTASNILEAA